MPKSNSESRFEKDLNGPQLQAVTSLEGAILIIAGAGSGKTRVITYRIASMLEKGIPQQAILALTFTNKAAREMENRVRELAGKKPPAQAAAPKTAALQRLTVSTFHAFGVKILREEIETLGYRKNFSIYDSTDKIELIKESLRECRLYGEKIDLKKMEALFSNVKTGSLKWGRVKGTEGFSSGNFADQIWEAVYNEYEKSLKIYNAVDFDDLLTIPIRLFEENPEILERYRRRYKYILVDEFQDTSLIQYKLLKLLAKPEGGKSNICVVGDDDQSIYSWRGANYENLLLFEKDFPDALEIKLEQNYRSTATILEAANGLISHNTNRKGKTLWSGNGEGKPIIIFHPENETAEAASIAAMVKKLRFAEKRNYSDFGVLVRTNNQFDCIEEAFLAENIPYRVSGGTSFFERKEIRDILSYLRIIANHDDDVNLIRIINTPRRGIGKVTIQSASEMAKKDRSSIYHSLFRIKHAKRPEQKQGALFQFEGAEAKENHSRTGIEEFLELVQNLKDDFFSGGALSKKVRGLVEKIDYWGYLVSEYSKDEKIARWKFTNIEYLLRMIEDWENDPDNLDPGLYAYLNRISLLTRTDGEDETSSGFRGKANIMTIHASKGLEFPVVFIAGAEEGIIPHERSIEDGGHSRELSLEEERRLFYVAITRAREKLYITSCKKRRRREVSSDRSPSPFLAEIPQGLIEYLEEEESSNSGDSFGSGEDFFANMRKHLGE